MSLKDDDVLAAKGATAPRVSVQDLEAEVEFKHVVNGLDLVPRSLQLSETAKQAVGALTVAIVVTKSGYTLIGTSAPASPENYDREKGEKFAYESALRQLWPLMGFALRRELAAKE